MVLILAFGLLVTLNLGQMVQDKIRLQNTSDASAYSLAVSEAQSFNFIAFTNRTQAAHYNAIMTVQSFQTMALFIESLFGNFLDIIWFLASVAQYFPPISGVVQGVASGIGKMMMGVQVIVTAILKGGVLKQIFWWANFVQYWTSVIIGGVVVTKILAASGQLTKINEARVNTGWGFYRIFSVGLTAWEYYQSFDFKTFKIPIMGTQRGAHNGYADPSDSTRTDGVNRRLQIMGEISNATRTENNRSDGQGSWNNNSNRGYKFDIGYKELVKFFDFDSKGQTKMVSANRDIGGEPKVIIKKKGVAISVFKKSFGVVEDIRYNDNPAWIRTHPAGTKARFKTSSFARGDTIASDQGLWIWLGIQVSIGPLSVKFGESWSMGVYMFSDNRGGEYWRWKNPNSGPTGIFGEETTSLNFSRYKPVYLRVPINIWDLIPGHSSIGEKFAEYSPTECFGIACGGVPGRWVSGSAPKSGCKDRFFSEQGHYEQFIKVNGICKWTACGGAKKLLPLVASARAKLDREIQNHKAVCDEEANQYYFGIYRYLKFEPNGEIKKDYNQPSTWMLLNLTTNATTGTTGEERPWHFNYNTGSNNMTTTNPIMGNGTAFADYRLGFAGIGLEPGLNVMSRARVYYHRPGNWEEHPNFFNPYWRAQLAPIAPKIQSFINLNFLDNTGESDGGSGLFSGLLGIIGDVESSINDLFATILQRIITH